MDKTIQSGLIILATVGFVAWLGGGRKWAFRTMAGALVLAGVATGGLLLYSYGSEKIAGHRNQKIHECAIAKVVDSNCEEHPADAAHPGGWFSCPAYILFDDATPEQEEAAVAVAEKACAGEQDPGQKSIHEQINEYERLHRINKTGFKTATQMGTETGPWTKYQAKGDIFDQLVKDCAVKVRKKYPRAYDDMNDETLVKKVLAKYPHYCSVGEGDPRGWEPVIEGIR